MYDEERARQIEQITKLSEENNKLLHKLVRAQNWATFWSILRWLIIIALSLGSYYYLQPYLDLLMKSYESLPKLPF